MGPDSPRGSLQVPRRASLQCCAVSQTSPSPESLWEGGDGVGGGTLTGQRHTLPAAPKAYGEPRLPGRSRFPVDGGERDVLVFQPPPPEVGFLLASIDAS